MKLVILREHFNFSWVLMSRILPFEQFLIIDIAHFLSELARLRSDFLFNELINSVSVIKIDVGKVTVVKGSVKHDSKVLARTKRTGVVCLVCRAFQRMKMLHFYQLFGKIICINDL